MEGTDVGGEHRDQARARTATVRLATLGVEATARVRTVSSAPPARDDFAQVRLPPRITGPGFAPFESGLGTGKPAC